MDKHLRPSSNISKSDLNLLAVKVKRKTHLASQFDLAILNVQLNDFKHLCESFEYV